MSDPVPAPRPRRRFLAVTVCLVIACTVVALFVGTRLRSPADVAAETAPPAPSRLTAEVERRALEAVTTLRGEVTGGSVLEVPAPTVTPPGATRSVVTRLNTSVGSSIQEGQVLAEVSGRPLFVMGGSLPSYRDLAPGVCGEDVAQLQDALRHLGFRITDKEGAFGVSTERAVAKFYENRNYSAATREMPAVEAAAPPVAGPAPTAPPPPQIETYVPQSELVFAPALPALVRETPLAVGDTPEGVLASLSIGQPRVIVNVPMETPVQLGTAVELVVEGQAPEQGTVAGVVPADAASTDPESDQNEPSNTAPGQAVEITTVRPTPAEMVGRPVLVTVRQPVTSGPVLVVPASAVRTSTDLKSYVLVGKGKNEERRLPVTVGASSEGFVEVQGEALAEGISVVTSS